MKFSLKQLRYIIAVAETGHFGRAADRCNITQSALSQQIAALETVCGQPLFDRDKRPVQLTPFGQDFVDRARNIWTEAEQLDQFASANTTHTALPNHALRFALIPTIAPYLLPHIYPALQQNLPHIRLAAMERQTEDIIIGLNDGDIDVAMIATDLPDGSHLTGVPLFADHFVLATSTRRPVKAPVSLNDVPREDLLLLDEGHCFRDQAIAACALKAGELARPFSATSLSTIVEFVANDQGVTLLPAISLDKEANDPRLAIHALKSPGAGRLLSLVWRKQSPYQAIYQNMAEIIKSACADRFMRPVR